MRTVLFYRDYRKFHGGHLKVWDYFNHVLASPEFTARIGFSKRTKWDSSNPWAEVREHEVNSWETARPDAFFVAGRDWRMVDRHPVAGDGIPVINLIQHVRHADPASGRFEFLSRRAIRVCVSEVVAEALRETGRTEGPVIAIPISVDLEALPGLEDAEPELDVLIAGLKQPERAAALAERLAAPGRAVEALTELKPRSEFLRRIASARVTAFLPNEAEGFHMPPLEGMAIGTLVVCPEHEGEHAIYEHGVNCFRPAYSIDELALAAESALALAPGEAAEMRARAREAAEAHSLPGEREAFLDVLHDMDRLW